MSDTSFNAPPRRRFKVSRKFLPYLLSLPALLTCIGILIPFFTAVWYSLQRYRLSQPWNRGFNWGENYLNFMTDDAFWNTLQVSLTYAFFAVTAQLLLGLGIALLLQKRSMFNNFVSIMLLMPLMTAPALAALMWKLMTNPGFGILSYLASLIGLEDFRWASDPQTAMLTVVIVDIWVYTPFIMILLLAGLRSLPQQPFEAAALDGVPRLFVFWRITLPMLTPFLLTATLFRVIESIQQFDIIYAMTQGGPGNTLTVFQVEAYLNFFQSTNVGRSAALLMILWAITYVLSNIFIKNWLRLREKQRGEA
ncbi:MAG: ABC transporter permease subunit [Rhodobacteraceae bacterium]|jgi:multiple sugar transport system permease protein|uniref:carbohydrate ABC transporter permease n=1 Tax=Roseobacteraceae TaxID=2854170 RepID=UPI0019361D72|nr:sugar ABC transporter permease [Roseovarius sp. 10]MBE1288774.1 ABC transporter permease subunit [Paracoccaceae bacterium]MBF9055884.1 ABC transporter permease subunit [Rhodobacterales bacterium HKCCA1065]MDV7200412.1 sugar ABC transporter permease [Roseovarius sp. 10]QPI85645.1 sugar ABC transporter permease [Rhodobacterales bacterium HKCCA1288]